ncbi:unnamed protein product, partial [Polarella glacialis]
ADFDRAVQGTPGARQGFASHLTDHIVDAFLSLLPGIRIPEVAGDYSHTAYRVLNLDMSCIKVRKDQVRVILPGSGSGADGGEPGARRGGPEEICLEASGISAEFRELVCKLKPRLMPQVSMTTNARATDMKFLIGLTRRLEPQSGGSTQAAWRLQVSSVEVSIADLQITLDRTVSGLLFNLIIGYLNESLKAHICKSLETKLRTCP